MPSVHVPSAEELEELDRVYRDGGLRTMASPHVHYDDAKCPHPDCTCRMEWIDFKLEVYGNAAAIYNPLVRAWWEGTGFAGRCPSCQGWIQLTTLRMQPLEENESARLPRLPESWHTVAQFA